MKKIIFLVLVFCSNVWTLDWFLKKYHLIKDWEDKNFTSDNLHNLTMEEAIPGWNYHKFMQRHSVPEEFKENVKKHIENASEDHEYWANHLSPVQFDEQHKKAIAQGRFFPENKNLFILQPQPDRALNADMIENFIKKHDLKNVAVPKHYITSDKLGRPYVLAETIHENSKRPQKLDLETVKELYKIGNELGFFDWGIDIDNRDSLPKNLIYSKGKWYIIDLEKCSFRDPKLFSNKNFVADGLLSFKNRMIPEAVSWLKNIPQDSMRDLSNNRNFLDNLIYENLADDYQVHPFEIKDKKRLDKLKRPYGLFGHYAWWI